MVKFYYDGVGYPRLLGDCTVVNQHNEIGLGDRTRSSAGGKITFSTPYVYPLGLSYLLYKLGLAYPWFCFYTARELGKEV